jgi:serine/threonine protein kinase
VETFFKSILRSGLLVREELQAAIADVPPDNRDDAAAIAEHLIKKGKLSRFQANKLLKGSAKGLILGDYQILAPLGKGGMGTVYMARDHRTGRLVALKVLPPYRARTEERTLIRFQREMELSKKLQHPLIALTYETGQYRSVYYIAMEYIPGKSLFRTVADEGAMNVPRAAHIGMEIALGLEYAHQQGMIHRDLKPSNILITPNDHAKILDLGLAIMAGEQGEATIIGGQGYIVGSMDYISPEQTYDARNVDPRADIYGLGCTLFFALTGQPPFPGGGSAEKIQKHRNELPPQLPNLRPDLPPDFADVIHRMMAKNPDLRYQTAKDVAETFRPWTLGRKERPLDRPDDSAFRLAVARLQTAEGSSELLQADLPPVGDTEDVLSMSVALDSTVTSGREKESPFHERRRQQAQLQFLLVMGGIGLGVLVVGVLILACLVSLLMRG